eukprot:364443-Chlamydomonas_euryale.AAC.11
MALQCRYIARSCHSCAQGCAVAAARWRDVCRQAGHQRQQDGVTCAGRSPAAARWRDVHRQVTSGSKMA